MKHLVRHTLVLLSLLVLTASAFAAPTFNEGGAPATNAILPMLFGRNLILKFALSTYGQSDAEKIRALADAQRLLTQYASQTRHIQRIETEADLAQLTSLYAPEFDSLQDEVQYWRSHTPPGFFLIEAGNPEMEKRIQDLWSQHLRYLGAFSEFPKALGLEDAHSANRQLAKLLFQHGDKAAIAPLFVNDAARLSFANLVGQGVGHAIAQIDQIGSLAVSSGALNHSNSAMKRFFELALTEYFRRLPTEAKLNTIARFLDEPEAPHREGDLEIAKALAKSFGADASSLEKTSSDLWKFELLVLGSGPQFQKLLQIYARDEGFSAAMRSIFVQLEDAARPTPFRIVKKMIDAENPPFKIIDVSPKPLGVGTMAQVYRAKIQTTDGQILDVVVRTLKWNIDQRLAQDATILRQVAPILDNDPLLRAEAFPKISPFVNEIIAMGENELNVPATVAAQDHASTVYNRDLVIDGVKVRFHVPKVYLVGQHSQVMVQEFVPGTGFAKLSEQQPALARSIVEEMVSMWLQEALLGGGFYHSDLHKGNMRVSRNGAGIQVNLLDYGMTGRLPALLQKKMMALALVVNSGRADLMAKAFLEIADRAQTTISAADLTRAIMTESTKLIRAGKPANDFIGWSTFALNNGVKFPSELASLNRGLVLLDQLLISQKSTKKFEDFLRGPFKRNPTLVWGIMRSMNSISANEWPKILTAAALEKQPIVTAGPSKRTRQACYDILGVPAAAH